MFHRKRDSYSKLENYLLSQMENFDEIKSYFTTKEKKNRVPPDQILEHLAAIPIPDIVQTGLEQYFNQPNTKKVLSLGGGGAKGIVGNAVLIYLLEKLNLIKKIDEIWGSSAGSITGAAYASGLSASEIIHLAAITRKREMLVLSLKQTITNTGLYRTDKILAFFKQTLLAKTFETCRIPFYCLAACIETHPEHIEIFSQGDLAEAVVASMSIPDVFEPMVINKKRYVDSGLIENTPCISVYERHQQQKDARKLTIMSTCFGETYFEPKTGGVLGKIINMLGVYRYQLQLEQLNRTRMQPQTEIMMMNIDVPISRTDFGKMSPEIVPAYKYVLNKMEKFCAANNWNTTF
jgi:NTE family protein